MLARRARHRQSIVRFVSLCVHTHFLVNVLPTALAARPSLLDGRLERTALAPAAVQVTTVAPNRTDAGGSGSEVQKPGSASSSDPSAVARVPSTGAAAAANQSSSVSSPPSPKQAAASTTAAPAAAESEAATAAAKPPSQAADAATTSPEPTPESGAASVAKDTKEDKGGGNSSFAEPTKQPEPTALDAFAEKLGISKEADLPLCLSVLSLVVVCCGLICALYCPIRS
eukprot:TRINITY_DN112934_c0_g1_i1.p2 TRINITY_DN112934_c0_g1~~TRINITY_DN112934_c0_g1_i1.p2  ORF type:complete len:228 (-),score=52.69 TRINITY_DN112934_c0_g1_i1:11-694(-)